MRLLADSWTNCRKPVPKQSGSLKRSKTRHGARVWLHTVASSIQSRRRDGCPDHGTRDDQFPMGWMAHVGGRPILLVYGQLSPV